MIEQKLNITHRTGSYTIFIGENLFGIKEALAQQIAGSHVCVVTNETVKPLYLDACLTALTQFEVEVVVLPDGEQYKNFTYYNQVMNLLCEKHYPRDSTLIALGGGVIGDLTGFAAATYQRGVAYIQVPTTLLSQVDSSIGGKTAINHAVGKNLIGAFYPPQVVLIDVTTLATLSQREYLSGLAELIKAALIADAEFFIWIEQHIDALLKRDVTILKQAIMRACQIKQTIVMRDELETMHNHCRILLNFGHTFGHAIEQVLGYGEWLHGEAVALGMHMATCLSQDLGLLDQTSVQRVYALLERAGYALQLPVGASSANLIQRMRHDKKVYSNCLNLILLQRIGTAVVKSDVPMLALQSVLERYSAH
jgi:3-dehydroquinate synthase